MDASADAGELETWREFFRDVDLYRIYVACCEWCDDPTDERFAALVKEIAKGDGVTEDTLLRLWGIR